MTYDPYSVLGVSRDASEEEIKKAYKNGGQNNENRENLSL